MGAELAATVSTPPGSGTLPDQDPLVRGRGRRKSMRVLAVLLFLSQPALAAGRGREAGHLEEQPSRAAPDDTRPAGLVRPGEAGDRRRHLGPGELEASGGRPLHRPAGESPALLELAAAGEVQASGTREVRRQQRRDVQCLRPGPLGRGPGEARQGPEELEKLVAAADEKTLQSWAPTLGRIATHNAYHTGQILLLRKMQGAWDPAKGVK